MGLETSTTIQGLNIAWPLGTDPRSEGDNHLRLTKTVLKNVFDDSNANSLLFKVIGTRTSKATNTQQFEAMQGSVVRGQLLWNVGAGIAALARLRCYDDAGAVVNTLALDVGGLALGTGVASLATIAATTITASGKIKGTDGEFGPASGNANKGINLVNGADALSGRLFFSNGVASTAFIMVQQADGTLLWNYGGTYGSSGGSNVARLHTTGTFNIASQMQASSYVGQAADRSTPRFGVAGRVGTGAALAWLNAYDEAGTEKIRIEITDNVFNVRPLAATTSAVIRITNGSNTRRLQLGYSTVNPFSLVAYNDSDVQIAALVASQTVGAPFWTYTSNVQAEMVTTASLNLTCYTGSTQDETNFPIGHTVIARGTATPARNGTATIRLGTTTSEYRYDGSGTALAGTWRCRGYFDDAEGGLSGALFQRTA